MLDRARKLWDRHCKPKPNMPFKVINQEKEDLPPEEEENPTDIYVYFLT